MGHWATGTRGSPVSENVSYMKTGSPKKNSHYPGCLSRLDVIWTNEAEEETLGTMDRRDEARCNGNRFEIGDWRPVYATMAREAWSPWRAWACCNQRGG